MAVLAGDGQQTPHIMEATNLHLAKVFQGVSYASIAMAAPGQCRHSPGIFLRHQLQPLGPADKWSLPIPHLYLDKWFLRAHLSTREEQVLEVRADKGEDEPVSVHAPPVPAGKHQVAEEGLGVAV